MNPRRAFPLAAVLVAACGGGAAVNAEAPKTPKPQGLLPETPTVELREADAALVGGTRVAFDGLAEGLVWPALEKALAKRPGGLRVIQVARDVPIQVVLRAVWTMRSGDVRLQTADDSGGVHVVELRAKPETQAKAATSACHAAVFVRPDGTLRVASRAGPRDIADAANGARVLAATLREENETCPLRYVAFGGATNQIAWGVVFDVLAAVDREKSAGDARYVLGEAIQPPP